MEEEGKLVELKIIVFGDVHGVGYRYFCQQAARKHGVTGYAKNVERGVEVVACGSQENTQAFRDELNNSKPHSATVEEIVVMERKNVSSQPAFFKIL